MIEKILERARTKSREYIHKSNEEASKNGNTLDFERFCGKKEAYEDMLVFVQEVAKEYDGGWIPCSERLPEVYEDSKTSDTVLVCTVDGFQHMAFWCSDNKWRYCESGMIGKSMEWTEIVAWQPLPAPYQKGE